MSDLTTWNNLTDPAKMGRVVGPKNPNLIEVVNQNASNALTESGNDIPNDELLKEIRKLVRNTQNMQEKWNLTDSNSNAFALNFNEQSFFSLRFAEASKLAVSHIVPRNYSLGSPSPRVALSSTVALLASESPETSPQMREFSLDGGSLGAGLVTISTTLLALNVILHQIFIHPLVGIITFVAGLGFVVMRVFNK